MGSNGRGGGNGTMLARAGVPQYKRHGGPTVQQEQAIDLLVLGKTHAEVAEALGVSRVTVTKWHRYDPYFQAGLNGRRRELWEASRERVQALIPKALARVERALEGDELNARTALE